MGTNLGLYTGDRGVAKKQQNLIFLPLIIIIILNLYLTIKIRGIPPSEATQAGMLERNINGGGYVSSFTCWKVTDYLSIGLPVLPGCYYRT